MYKFYLSYPHARIDILLTRRLFQMEANRSNVSFFCRVPCY